MSFSQKDQDTCLDPTCHGALNPVPPLFLLHRALLFSPGGVRRWWKTNSRLDSIVRPQKWKACFGLLSRLTMADSRLAWPRFLWLNHACYNMDKLAFLCKTALTNRMLLKKDWDFVREKPLYHASTGFSCSCKSSIRPCCIMNYFLGKTQRMTIEINNDNQLLGWSVNGTRWLWPFPQGRPAADSLTLTKVGRTQRSVSVCSLSISILFLHCTMSILWFCALFD